MFPYAIVMIPACLSLLLVRQTSESAQRRVAYVIAIIITGFAGLRGYVGTDTYAYHRMFENFSTESVTETIQFTEPVFVALIKAAASISDDSFVFIALISIVQGLILIRLVKASSKPSDMLAIYIAMFFVNFQFNILRAGTAILFLLAARQVAQERNGKLFYFFCFSAIFSHYSAAVAVLPMIFMRERHLTKRILALALGLPVVGVTASLLISPGQIEKYAGYVEEAQMGFDATYGAGFFVLLLLYSMLYFSVLNKKNFLPLTTVFLIWVAMRWMSNHVLFLDRFEIIVNALLIYGIVEKKIAGWQSQTRTAALVGLVCLSLYGTLAGLEKADAGARGLENLDGRKPIYSSPYIPYKFFWNE